MSARALAIALRAELPAVVFDRLWTEAASGATPKLHRVLPWSLCSVDSDARATLNRACIRLTGRRYRDALREGRIDGARLVREVGAVGCLSQADWQARRVA